MMDALRVQRITGVGGRAPYDFVPGDGLVTECHIKTDSLFHRFPPTTAKASYMPDTTTRRANLVVPTRVPLNSWLACATLGAGR
jgi:hypothetical protein